MWDLQKLSIIFAGLAIGLTATPVSLSSTEANLSLSEAKRRFSPGDEVEITGGIGCQFVDYDETTEELWKCYIAHPEIASQLDTDDIVVAFVGEDCEPIPNARWVRKEWFCELENSLAGIMTRFIPAGEHTKHEAEAIEDE